MAAAVSLLRLFNLIFPSGTNCSGFGLPLPRLRDKVTFLLPLFVLHRGQPGDAGRALRTPSSPVSGSSSIDSIAGITFL